MLHRLRQGLAAAFQAQHLKKAVVAMVTSLTAQARQALQILAVVVVRAAQARQATVHPALAVLAS
jgi:hypothetical protein